MTGCLQTHARLYRIAIDRLAFSFQVQVEEEPEEIEELPEDGVYVHGFFMDGARFNRDEGTIDDQIPVSTPNYKFLGRALQQNANHLVQAS